MKECLPENDFHLVIAKTASKRKTDDMNSAQRKVVKQNHTNDIIVKVSNQFRCLSSDDEETDQMDEGIAEDKNTEKSTAKRCPPLDLHGHVNHHKFVNIMTAITRNKHQVRYNSDGTCVQLQIMDITTRL